MLGCPPVTVPFTSPADPICIEVRQAFDPDALRLVLARCLDAVAIRSIVYICVLMMFSGKRPLFLDDNATRDSFLSLHIGSGLLRRHYGCLMVQ